MSVGIYIGRYQPFHIVHLQTVEFALDKVDSLVIIIGSANKPSTKKNPYSSNMRELMIRSSTEKFAGRIHFVHQFDYDCDEDWMSALKNNVAPYIENQQVKLFGFSKDASSFYLKLFPDWEHINTDFHSDLSATTIRDLLSNGEYDKVKELVPDPVFKILMSTNHGK